MQTPGADGIEPAGAADARASAAALYGVLVLAFAIGLVGTILAVGRRPAKTEGVAPVRSSGRPTATREDPLAGLPPPDVARLDSGLRVHAPRPARSPDVYPCSACHTAGEDDLEPRRLKLAHAEVALDHGPGGRWCFDCHDPLKRDLLRLADGTDVPLDDSTRLCSQCHGRAFRDWEQGIHGKRTGYWSGAKLELVCVDCHRAHTPRFEARAPLAPPVRPAH